MSEFQAMLESARKASELMISATQGALVIAVRDAGIPDVPEFLEEAVIPPLARQIAARQNDSDLTDSFMSILTVMLFDEAVRRRNSDGH